MSNIMPPASGAPDLVELLLRRIAQRTLATSLLPLAAACGGCALEASDDDAHERRDDTPPTLARQERGTPTPAADAGADAGLAVGADAPITCAPGSSYPVRAAGLQPAATYDYIAIREVHDGARATSGAPDDWSRTNATTLSESGNKCATATTPACATQIAGHPSAFVASQCVQLCTEHAVVTTRGDVVRRWLGPELPALLGEIDSPDEALLLVSFAGYTLRCDDAAGSTVRAVDGGYEVTATRMTKDCAPIITTRYRLFVSHDGSLRVLSQVEHSRLENACVGRMSAHIDLHHADAGASPLGDYLARSAQLEEASVHAFAQLARELEAHGAPVDLVARARDACDDEVRHANLVAELALRRGGVPGVPAVHPLPVRPLEQIAIENAVEGCVRETFGALVGAYQGERASDRVFRHAMAGIAVDEARHAALSHAVHAWLLGVLDADARARVLRAQISAIGELACAASIDPDEAVRDAAGLPTAETARWMIDALARELWLPSLAA